MISEDYLDDFEDDVSEIDDVFSKIIEHKENSSLTTDTTTLANVSQKKKIMDSLKSPQIMKLKIQNFKESSQILETPKKSKLNQSCINKNNEQKQFTPEIRSQSKHEDKSKTTPQTTKKNTGLTSIYQKISFQQSVFNNRQLILASYQQKFHTNIYQKVQEQKPKNIFAIEQIIKPTITSIKDNQLFNKKQAEEQIRGCSLGPKFQSKIVEGKSPFKLEYFKKDYAPKKDKSQLRKLNHSGPSTRIPSERQLQNRTSYNKDSENSDILPYHNVSAQCWCVVDGDTGQLLLGKNENMQREVASITKVMTCYVTLKLAQRLNLKLDNTYFEVSKSGATIGGTSANLCSGDQLTIKDLLYGLMLPSGNDAALTIAENFADFIDEDDLTQEDKEMMNQFRMRKNAGPFQQTDFFISQMNLQGKQLGLNSTFYANPHGNKRLLVMIFKKDQQIKKTNPQHLILQHYAIMQFKIKHSLKLFKLNFIFQKLLMKMQGYSKEVFWDNTNKLLYKGFCGIKTGITQRSGPCVVEQYKDDKINLIIVLLNSKTTEERWADAFKILQWFRENQNYK